MAKNTYFTHGTREEQMLQQSLVDEFINMFGITTNYIPRKLIRQDTILNEEIISEFEDAFTLEAYLENFEGFQGAGDILTKFGIRSTDEITLVISRHQFEDFVSLPMQLVNNVQLPGRPAEGDLIYFPLSDNIFEVKFVEHEAPFYQFGKLYTYKLKCELFEYSNEVTGDGIFDTQKDEGFIVKYFYEQASLSGSPEVGELVTGSETGLTAYINSWNPKERYVELRAPTGSSDHGEFKVGENLVGSNSGFSINISNFDELDMKDSFADNIEFEKFGDGILDFTEINPFGEFGNR
jgi:hypothetical protein